MTTLNDIIKQNKEREIKLETVSLDILTQRECGKELNDRFLNISNLAPKEMVKELDSIFNARVLNGYDRKKDVISFITVILTNALITLKSMSNKDLSRALIIIAGIASTDDVIKALKKYYDYDELTTADLGHSSTDALFSFYEAINSGEMVIKSFHELIYDKPHQPETLDEDAIKCISAIRCRLGRQPLTTDFTVDDYFKYWE